MNKKLVSLLLGVLSAFGVCNAQMEISFSGLTDPISKTTLSDGSTLIKLPAGTDLNNLKSLGMSVTIDGKKVNPEDIKPNPTTTYITEYEIETFVYNNRAYSFRFTSDGYFTAVILSDPHVAQDDYSGATVEMMQKYVDNIIQMGQVDGKKFSFTAAPQYVPTADIVLCLGDMDKDRETSGSNFTTAFSALNTIGIPFVTMAGNHDLDPDYWDDNSAGYTLEGGIDNQVTLDVISTQLANAEKNGITDLHEFTDSSIATITGLTYQNQPRPFTFKFKGVRFYCGQTYWFQKPWLASFSTSSVQTYAPDNIIDALDNFVTDDVAQEPSVWMQHYPFVYGSDCDRWWLDQNSSGKSLSTNSQYTTADAKKSKLASIINRTKNPVHFSGHVHSYGDYTYAGIADHTVSAAGPGNGAAFIVLLKQGVGVVEIQRVSFNY